MLAPISPTAPPLLYRIGGTSALFAAGASPESIKALGRWWSGAYMLYLRSSAQAAQRLQQAMCSSHVHALEAQIDDHFEGDDM